MADSAAETDPLLSDNHRSLPNVASSASNDHVKITSSRLYYKDLLFLCISFLLIFTGYMPLQNMESTLNQNSGLGEASLACVYFGVVIAGFFAPLFIHYIGCKWSVVACFVGQAIFAATNVYPAFYTLVPSSLLIGVLSAPMWTAVGSYVTVLAAEFAAATGKVKNQVISQFNGIFFLFFQSAQITGNLVSSFVLESGNSTSPNKTDNCGFKYCDLKQPNSDHNKSVNNSDSGTDSSTSPSQTLVYILIGIFVALDIVAIFLMSCFVQKREANQEKLSTRQSILSTVKLHGDRRVQMLLPMFTYIGMEQAFLFGEYTKAFPGCVLGVGDIGFIMITFGVTDALFSFISGRMEKLVGRVFLFSAAIVINICMLITMIFWFPGTEGQRFIFYLIPGLWGVADAVWQTTTSAFLGAVFFDKLEPVFATFRMWMALGFAILFSISHFLCMDIKIYLTIGAGVISMALYYCVEVKVRTNQKQSIMVETKS